MISINCFIGLAMSMVNMLYLWRLVPKVTIHTSLIAQHYFHLSLSTIQI